MGEVYRARDTRLSRDVAIKVLPASYSTDPDRLRRFEQEARATAALNHPNILAVFDVGMHDGAPYVVAELLYGETLRETLSTGALPLKKAVDYAVQISSGARRRARGRHRPSRSETRKSVHYATGTGEDSRLRIGEAGRNAFQLRRWDRLAHRAGRDVRWTDTRHARVHVARTGAGTAVGPSHRHFRVRCRSLRDGVRTAAIPGGNGRRYDDGDSQGRTTTAFRRRPACLRRALPDRRAMSGEESRRALQVGRRPRLRASGTIAGI